MQVNILSGVTMGRSGVIAKHPVNLIPTVQSSGLSGVYLRPAYGIDEITTQLYGLPRGGITWKGYHYRVLGSKLVSIDRNGFIIVLGDVGGGTDRATFNYSFDRLSISVGGKLYYYNGTLTQVTDVDLGNVIDHIWVDGYFMATDGEFVVVTDLANPTSVSQFNYISSEADPDNVVAIRKLHNEPYICNRHTIEVLNNVGGANFPFERVEGAQIQKGVVGKDAVCVFEDVLYFVGSGRNEALGLYSGKNGSIVKISGREVDEALNALTENEQSQIVIEGIVFDGSSSIIIHLPNKSIVFDSTATQLAQVPIFYDLVSGLSGYQQYCGRDFLISNGICQVVSCVNGIVGNLTSAHSKQFGEHVRWEANTLAVYNEGKGFCLHECELIAITGFVEDEASIDLSYSDDSITFSQPRRIRVGTIGNRAKRLTWSRLGIARNYRLFKISGDSSAFISLLRLEMKIEGLFR